jgi:hypothetical protein
VRAAALLLAVLLVLPVATGATGDVRAPRLGLPARGADEECAPDPPPVPVLPAVDDGRRVRVDVALTGPDGVVLTSELRTRSGRWAATSRVVTRPLLLDYDVEIACDNSGGLRPSAIGDPQVVPVREGLAIEVRPTFADGGRKVVLETALDAFDLDDPVESLATGARFLGEIDLPRGRRVRAEASGCVASGGTLALDLPVGGSTWRLALTPRRLGAIGSDGPAPDAVRIDLALRAGDEEVGRASLAALAGRAASLGVGRERWVLADYDVEVGCYISIADPVVRAVFDGIELTARADLSPDGRRVLLDLDGSLTTLDGEPRASPPRDVVNGRLHRVRRATRDVAADLVLTPGVPKALALDPLPDGREASLVVTASVHSREGDSPSGRRNPR